MNTADKKSLQYTRVSVCHSPAQLIFQSVSFTVFDAETAGLIKFIPVTYMRLRRQSIGCGISESASPALKCDQRCHSSRGRATFIVNSPNGRRFVREITIWRQFGSIYGLWLMKSLKGAVATGEIDELLRLRRERAHDDRVTAYLGAL